MRKKEDTVTFHDPFNVKGIDETFPPGTYKLSAQEEQREAGPVQYWRTVSLSICTPSLEREPESQTWVAVDPDAFEDALALEKAAQLGVGTKAEPISALDLLRMNKQSGSQ